MIIEKDATFGEAAMKTEGLWYSGERRVELRGMEIPEPGPEDVLVSLEVCGICNWDVQSYAGKFGAHQTYPFCAGHEGVGRVIAVGDRVDKDFIGRRVAMEEAPVGAPGGALMARHATRRRDRVAIIPEDGKPSWLWIVEPLCCVVNGIMYAGLQPGDRVAVIGAGYMGLLFVQGLSHSLTGAVAVFDLDQARLDLAAEFGADEVYNAREELPPELSGGFDVIFETAATPRSMELSLNLAKTGAAIETFAWHHHSHQFNLEDWHVRGLRFLNIQPGVNPHFGDLYPRTIALTAKGVFSNEKLITHVAPVEKAHEAFDPALDKTEGYIKGVITF